MKRKSRIYLPILIAISLLFTHYLLFRSRGVCEIFNTGFAFGLGSNTNIYLSILIGILPMLLILILFLKSKDSFERSIYISITILSLQNFFERITGGICDYIDIKIFNFPLFNLLDFGIVLGVGVLMIKILRSK